MLYEVENKYPVKDLQWIIGRLECIGTEFGQVIQQTDLYFSHPVRDYAVTDEALRIRRVGSTNLVTYKGPKVDTQTKTREELELPLADGPERAEQYAQLLELLGFRRVAEVHKQRRPGRCRYEDTAVQFALDDVDGVGTYVELEISATAAQLDAAKDTLNRLTSQLGLENPERRSYLELLLASR